MSIWNVLLRRRQRPIKVKEVLSKEPEFMVILDDRGKQHELSEVDFPSYEWGKIVPGATITLTIRESVTGWRVQAPKIQERVKELIAEAQDKALSPYCIWVCQDGEGGYVEYGEDAEPQVIADRIIAAHQKLKPGCDGRILVFDNRGVEQEKSGAFLASRMAVKAA